MKKKPFSLMVPKGWRLGQTIFNFLWFLRLKGYDGEPMGFDPVTGQSVASQGRMADPFHIEDGKFIKLYEEFLAQHPVDK